MSHDFSFIRDGFEPSENDYTSKNKKEFKELQEEVKKYRKTIENAIWLLNGEITDEAIMNLKAYLARSLKEE